MKRYTITALVPEPLHTTLADLRRQHDRFTRQWLPPHITLIPPFDYYFSREQLAALKSIPVNVTAELTGWGSFRRDQTSVIFQQLTAGSFDAVRTALGQTISDLIPLTPTDSEYHVTVVSRIPNELFDQVQQSVTANRVSGSFTVDRVHVFEWDDDLRRWIEVL